MDAPGVYAGARRRISELARTLSPEELATRVPASPLWTVYETIAHLVGVAEDMVAGRFEGAATDEWTAAQVERRRGRSLDELLADWDEAGPALERLLADVPQLGVTAVDALTHEADVFGALGRPPAIDADDVDVVVQRLVPGIGRRLEQSGGPALRIRAGVDEWVVGPGEPAATLTLDPYELFRAGLGRRSQDQIRAYDWDGDPEPFLPRLSVFPFPADDLREPRSPVTSP